MHKGNHFNTFFLVSTLLSYCSLSYQLDIRCSTTVESFPSPPDYSLNHGLQPEIQKMRILVGSPLKNPPKHQMLEEMIMPVFPSIDLKKQTLSVIDEFIHPAGLSDFVIFCMTDFSSVSKEVHLRTRRVRLIGLEVLHLNATFEIT